jgi:hypothetical protein
VALFVAGIEGTIGTKAAPRNRLSVRGSGKKRIFQGISQTSGNKSPGYPMLMEAAAPGPLS